MSSRAALNCSWCLLLIAMASCQPDNQVASSLYEASFATEPATTILVERVDSSWVIRNGKERIALISLGNELYQIPVFGGSWRGQWQGEVWQGEWTDSLRADNYSVPVHLKPLSAPQHSNRESQATPSTWSTTEGLLHLKTERDSVWATISTPTGDYRYLSGFFDNNTLTMSTFDGAHLFRFQADMVGDSLIQGEFLSGTHYRTPFSGVRLQGASNTWESSTQKPVSNDLVFRAMNPQGDSVVWSQEALLESGKRGLVLDVMGTWCPNCMDETRLLRELAKSYPEIQFISLAFERQNGSEALSRLQAFRSELNLPWEIWLGGRASKSEAASAISAVDDIVSFPTTLFWPLEGEPTIHTGFNGPATGDGYDVERAFFKRELDRISGRSGSR